jgi:hypothetical protein
VHDNQGWITNSSEGTALRISSPLSALELGLGAVKGFSFSANTVESQRHTPVIYHRMAPSSDDLVSPTLVILPPAGKLPNGGLARDSGQGALAVTRWTSSHPLLKYVNPSLLSFPVARTLQCPGATNPILFSKNGALACAGEVNGVPYGVVGFELFPFDGKRSATVSIFTLNLLSWLAEGSTRSSLTQRPGLIALPRGTTEARYIAPETKTLSIDQQRSTITAPVPGIIELTAEKTRSFMAITLSAREESALNRLPPLTAPAGSVASAAPRSTETPSDLTSWLALVALLTLIGDLIRRIAVRQRWSEL